MKRFFLLIVLVMVVSWLASSRRSPRPSASERYAQDGGSGRRAAETHRKARRALAEARDEVREALAEARDDVGQAFDEARDEVHHALDEVRVAFVSTDEPASPASPEAPLAPLATESVDGVPVPIVPGTRVTSARSAPPAPRALAVAPAAANPAPSSRWNVTGRLSATKERAVADARVKLRDEVATWLGPEVPRSWSVPTRMLDAMLVGEPKTKSTQKDYGELFDATLAVDASPQRRTTLVELYHRELVEQRLLALGGSLAFVLICLAAVSGYIRADEATRGYYTNRLRMLTAAGVGASGVILYHLVA